MSGLGLGVSIIPVFCHRGFEIELKALDFDFCVQGYSSGVYIYSDPGVSIISVFCDRVYWNSIVRSLRSLAERCSLGDGYTPRYVHFGTNTLRLSVGDELNGHKKFSSKISNNNFF